MNISADWAMVAITTVYVVATIVICIFNFRSAKAIREQNEELKRQFDEVNRPYVTCEYFLEKRIMHGIRITNHGKKVAENVKLKVNKEFVDFIKNRNIKVHFERLNEYTHTIGVGQSFDFYFSENADFKNPDGEDLKVVVDYKSKERSFSEEFYFEFKKFAPVYSTPTAEEDIKTEITKINKNLEHFNNQVSNFNSIYKVARKSKSNRSRYFGGIL